ncbi:DUF4910 domain-containing protein, partial [Paracoccaceae bacterium]|nr:DUF4910 domain-containing protein [Paracoccaceae bacterium]
VGYSNSFEGRLPLKDLLPNLYTLKEQPQAVPYITNYYADGWGFCIPFEEYDVLEDGIYTVVVDTEHFDGILNYAELIIEGDTGEEVFLSTYICHPSMANNELSGPCVLTFIADWLQSMTARRYTYRIVFVPETIGSLVYLHERLDELKEKVVAGFNISCIGDDRCFSYLPSRHGSTPSDIAALHALKWTDPNFIKYSWLERGSDERQYCAPGVDLPVASIMRSKYGTYPEYHTSLDDLDNVVTPAGLRGGFGILKSTIQVLERNYFYRATVLGEPQLSQRGLYPTVSSKNVKSEARLFIDILSMADGRTSLIEIVDALNMSVWDVESVINRLISVGLLERSE